MLLRLGDSVEIARDGAQIDEGHLPVGVLPWDDEDGVIGGAFGGPLGKHLSIIQSRASQAG